MSDVQLYPLRFEPIYQYRPWGGRRLLNLLNAPLPGEGPIGEAWVLSDRDDQQSVVANGPLKGHSIRELMEQCPERLMGSPSHQSRRFPLLLKFLDAHEMLSVQVHPADRDKEFLPPGENGKTEAWAVVEASRKSRIYAGLKPGITKEILERAVRTGSVVEDLAWFAPKAGDAVFTPAGTVHALGGDVVVFEIQQNSDVTFRLYDWGHIDANTGKLRDLQIGEALACIEFGRSSGAGLVQPVVESATPVRRESLFNCAAFEVCRLRGSSVFTVGVAKLPRVLVCIKGAGQLDHNGESFSVTRGEVFLLPATVGACAFRPSSSVILLEIALPE